MKKFGKYFLITLAVILILMVGIILSLRLPYVQQKITNYATNFVSEKTNTVVRVEQLYVTFLGAAQIEGLYLEDQQKDTLLYAQSIQVDVAWSPLIDGFVKIKSADLTGLVGKVYNNAIDSNYNYQFLIDAFASADSTVNISSDVNSQKDSASVPFSLTELNLNKLRFSHADVFTEMKSSVMLKSLQTTFDSINFNGLLFDVNEFSLAGVNFSYSQGKAFPVNKDTSSSTLPIIKLRKLDLEKIQIHYAALYDSLFLNTSLNKLGLKQAAIDLEKQLISSDDFAFNAADFSLQMAEEDTLKTDHSNPKANTAFQWPSWEIKLGRLDFQLAKLAIDQGAYFADKVKYFNPSHLHYKDVSIQSNNLKFAPENIRADQFQASVASEDNDFQIKKLNADLKLNDSSLKIDNLTLQTAHTYLESDQQLSYNNLSDLFEANLNELSAKIAIKAGTSIDLKEAYYFAPDLKNISVYDSIAQERIKLYGQIEGDAQSTSFKNLYMLYGNKSSLQLSGRIKNWLDSIKTEAIVEQFKLNAFINDFNFLMPESYASSYPNHIKLNGAVKYTAEKLGANLEGSLDKFSQIKLDANFSFNNDNPYTFQFSGHDLAIDKWFQDSVNLSPLSLQIEAKGAGLKWPNLSTSMDLKVAKFKYQNHTFDTLSLALKINKGLLDMSSKYADEILKYQLLANGNLDSSTQKINLNLELDQLNLNAFQLTDSTAYLQTSLSATGLIDSLSQSLSLHVSRLSFADQESYFELAPVELKLMNGKDSSAIDFNWEKIALKLNLNQALSSLNGFQMSPKNLMSLNLFKIDSSDKPIDLAISLDAAISNDLNALLKEQLDFDPIKMRMQYNSKKKKLDLSLKVPELRFNQITIDSLEIDLQADSASLQLTNTIKKIESGFLNIFTTSIKAVVNSDHADFSLNMEDELGDSLFILHAKATNKSDSLLWSIDTESIVLNGEKWQLDEKNYFFIGQEHFLIRHMAFQRSKESFLIETIEQNELHGLHINFQDFNVGNLIAILNPEDVVLTGVLNGDLRLADLSNPLNFKARIALAEIKVLDEPAGTLELTSSQVTEGKYELQLDAKGPVDLNGAGTVTTNTEVPTFDFNLKLNQLDLPFITVFSQGLIQDAEGSLSGNFAISGTPEDYMYNGSLRFKDATLFITELNTSFSLPDEVILLNNSTVRLKSFTVLDKQQHKMVLNGTIKTDDLLNPKFDLKLNADNFQLMNKEKEANSLYYGTAFIDAEASIKGSIREPIIRADLKINENTDFVYVVPTSTVDIVQMEGIVKFKSPYEALDSLKNSSDSTPQSLDIIGVDLNALIKTDKNAKFRVVIDERRGDYLIVSGESDLNFELDKNGDVKLTGNYLVNDGFYQLSLYDLVKRKFEITSGSQVKWYGDPMEAGLNITANYNLETSPNTLMVNQNVSTRKLPFVVELFINGSLAAPEISFGLSMPQDARGALGGRVYQQIQAINNNETELNKQVFSLLVLNQFFPAGSSGEGPDSEVLARNSASQILTNQLNKLSGQYIKGVDLNLDLDSYKANENGAAEQRTQLGLSLSKSLFDDRFKVQVGSQFELEGEQRGKQSASDILGNILVEYLLTEDGRYKLTGYRKNEYEGLIDGQVTVTGVSVQFNKEFEKFSDLLNEANKSSDEE